MPGIFISYRRLDTRAEARAIFERLSRDLPGETIFIDLEGIDYGVDFARVIDDKLKQCDVALVLIGARWLEVDAAGAVEGRRRIDDENDFVRLETRAVLQRDIRVVPVLVGNARLPSSDELPEDLRPLLRRHKFDLDFETFDADMRQLVASLKRMTAAAPAAVMPAVLPQEVAAPAPVPGKPRRRSRPVDVVATEPASARVPASAPKPSTTQAERWWQSALSRITTGSAVVVVLGYQAWHNDWWRPDQPASPAAAVAQPNPGGTIPRATLVASGVRVGTAVAAAKAVPSSAPSAAPAPAGVASVAAVALGRPISIKAAVEQGRPVLPVARSASRPTTPSRP